MDLWPYFVLGLTSGGLTCLAVQGGLLAMAIARPVSAPSRTSAPKKSLKTKRRNAEAITAVQIAKNPWPVAYFLGAKLIAHTLLGALLGWLGTVVQITPTAQGIMQILAALLMLTTALNMLNVHPIFRYFVIQPPRAFTRLVRNQAKSQEIFTPVLLGFLTILIPCGTTQAMEVVAISSGSPLAGTLIMFAFILGTAPTFFVLGFLATQLRGKVQKMMVVATACLIFILGVVSLDAGLNLLGSPLAPSRIWTSALQITGVTPSGTPIPARLVNGVQTLDINVYSTRYSPNYLVVKRDMPVQIRLITNKTFGCSRAFVIPKLGVQRMLPETGETLIDLPAQKPGTIFFSCSMGMYTGTILVS